jgi:hypothetical protein
VAKVRIFSIFGGDEEDVEKGSCVFLPVCDYSGLYAPVPFPLFFFAEAGAI